MDSNTPIETGRQSVLTATRTLAPSDTFESGVEQAVIYLRPGTRLLSAFIDVGTAWDTAGSATIGDTASGDADSILTVADLTVTGVTANATLPLEDGVMPTPEAITATITSAGANADSVGSAVLVVTLIEEDRTTELYPYRG